jgi:hypothetical protein
MSRHDEPALDLIQRAFFAGWISGSKRRPDVHLQHADVSEAVDAWHRARDRLAKLEGHANAEANAAANAEMMIRSATPGGS